MLGWMWRIGPWGGVGIVCNTPEFPVNIQASDEIVYTKRGN